VGQPKPTVHCSTQPLSLSLAPRKRELRWWCCWVVARKGRGRRRGAIVGCEMCCKSVHQLQHAWPQYWRRGINKGGEAYQTLELTVGSVVSRRTSAPKNGWRRVMLQSMKCLCVFMVSAWIISAHVRRVSVPPQSCSPRMGLHQPINHSHPFCPAFPQPTPAVSTHEANSTQTPSGRASGAPEGHIDIGDNATS
jgi:hypothetical protein